MFFHAIDKCFATDVKVARRLSLIARGFFESAQKQLAFNRIKIDALIGYFQIEARTNRSLGVRLKFSRQIFIANELPIREHEHALNYVFKFANIAGPAVAGKTIDY